MKVEDLKKFTLEISVLYVEDDDLIREQTAEFLKKFFKSVDLALDGKDGLNKFKAGNQDIVIADINMPEMNGVEMIRYIKKINPEQIVVVTSAHNESEYLIPLINVGVDRFLLKPFDRKLFISILYRLSRSLLFERQKEILEIKMQSSALELQTVMNAVDNGIIVVDDGEVQNVNQKGMELFFANTKTDIQKIFNTLTEFCVATDGYMWGRDILDLIEKVKDEDEVYRMLVWTPTGQATYRFTCHNLDGEDKYVLSFIDVTALDDHTRYDQFTELPNKTYIAENLTKFKDVGDYIVYLVSIKNHDSVVKWHGRQAGGTIEKKTADTLKDGFNKLGLKEEAMLGYFGQNLFIIVSKEMYKEKIAEKIAELSMQTSIKEGSHSHSKKEIFLTPNFKLFPFTKEDDTNKVMTHLEEQGELLKY